MIKKEFWETWEKSSEKARKCVIYFMEHFDEFEGMSLEQIEEKVNKIVDSI